MGSGLTGKHELSFLSDFGESGFPNREQDARQMIEEIEATSWCLRECIRVRELAATHRLGRMHFLRMLEEQKIWKRKADFDRVEMTAKMDEQRVRTGLDLESFFFKLYNPRWPHTSEEHTLELNVEVEILRMEIVLLQPVLPPQCDSWP